MARRFAIGAAAIALAAAAGSRASAGNRSTANPAFSPEIQTILQTHCTMCHSAGGPSPMPLVSYDDVLPWARSIKEQTLTRRMPKWSAARGYGAFANDPTLTPYELSLITAWVDAGSPPGPERTTPAAPRQIRPGLAIDAGATTATIRTRSGWITGWDFRPGDPLITSVTFTSSDGATIGTWVAGDRTVRLPRGSAIRVVPPVRVEIRRREKTSYEAAFAPLKSTLRLIWTPAASQRPHSDVVRRVSVCSLIERAHGRTSSYDTSGIGEGPPGEWHIVQCVCRIVWISGENAGFVVERFPADALDPAAAASAIAAAPIAKRRTI